MSKPIPSAAQSAKQTATESTSASTPAIWLLGMAFALTLSGCASSRGPVVIESSSGSMNEQADRYEQRARELQQAGSGRQGAELRRLADKQRLDAKSSEPKGFVDGALDLVLNSLFQSWLASSPKGLQK
ncbi:hypothetical protein LNV08_16200 [Paucibacter sp. TC2R-5]|uniref:hypothetical protein n=1 Tax=Paucibacter sp. TC2R-5 TaxID=2893555 RepID=UPI0021E36D5E|nr:hypothetical protein [Paucibacter sp. TC2R-5]MCV2360518.1 hypothetical protein [Paucibacter sp. TC2R-5]